MEKCECVKKWMKEIMKKYNAYDVCSDISYNMEKIGIRRIVTEKDPYSKNRGNKRVSYYRSWVESKYFKFCPHCGKQFANSEVKE